MQSKKDSSIMNKKEKTTFESWLRKGIPNEINILDELTKEDYETIDEINDEWEESTVMVRR